MKFVKPVLFAACACVCAAASAAGDTSLPQEAVQGSISYLSGGVGKDEADAMKRAASRYSLALEFSQRGQGAQGDFVADVNLTIEDKAGNTVLQTQSAGPFVLINMPDGKYTVKAEENGKTQVRRVTVAGGKSEHISMVW